MTYKLNNAKTAAVSLDTFWKPVDDDTPNGVKVLAINQRFGVALITIFRKQDGWTHWHGLPRFKTEETQCE